MTFFPVLILGLLAATIGALGSALIYRIPKGASIFSRSCCLKCERKIKVRHNIPLFSYIFLRGKCAYCNKQISMQYPLIELLTVLLCLLTVTKVQGGLLQSAWFIFAAIGLVLVVIDLNQSRLPNALTYPLNALLLVLVCADSFVKADPVALKRAIFSAVGLALFYFIVNIASRGGMGMGDVKFSFSIGLLAGYQSAMGVYVASIISFILGSIVGITIIVLKKGNRKTALPFGPFMYMGAILSLWATPAVAKYLG